MDKRAMGVSFFTIGSFLLSSKCIADAIQGYSYSIDKMIVVSIIAYIIGSLYIWEDIKALFKKIKDFLYGIYDKIGIM